MIEQQASARVEGGAAVVAPTRIEALEPMPPGMPVDAVDELEVDVVDGLAFGESTYQIERRAVA